MKNEKTRRVLLASTVAGLFAMTAGASFAHAEEATEGARLTEKPEKS